MQSWWKMCLHGIWHAFVCTWNSSKHTLHWSLLAAMTTKNNNNNNNSNSFITQHQRNNDYLFSTNHSLPISSAPMSTRGIAAILSSDAGGGPESSNWLNSYTQATNQRTALNANPPPIPAKRFQCNSRQTTDPCYNIVVTIRAPSVVAGISVKTNQTLPVHTHQ